MGTGRDTIPIVRAAVLLLIVSGWVWAQKKPFDAEALWRIARISEPQLSPDGKFVVFTVEQPDVEGNRRPKHIWITPISGGAPVQLTREGTSNTRPRWLPDSEHIVFVSNRGGSSQIWKMRRDGSAAQQVTNLATEADGVVVSADGKHLVFTSLVYPDCNDEACNKARLEAEEKNPVKARVYTTLLFRHWNEWKTARKRHILAMAMEGGTYVDLTPGAGEAPPFSLGGPDDYAISPDGKEVAYVANRDPVPAISTNHDIYTVPISGGPATQITINPGADVSPLYSPDGKYLAFRSQARAGFESDRWRLMLFDRTTKRLTSLTESLDRPVESFTWARDGSRLFFVAQDRGRGVLYSVSVNGGGLRAVISGPVHVDDVQFSPDGKTMVFSQQSGSSPVEIFRVASTGGAPTPLTKMNESLLAQFELRPFEEFWVESSDRSRVHSFLVKPPAFEPKRKYPALILIHGGPQGAWGESWSYRWNAQVFASAGFVVVLLNPRGSTGYGQKFTDEVSQDWGGKAFEDLMDVTDYVASLPYIDKDRMAAGGGSYGGYMVNWILGHTNRFRALVSHAGVFDLPSEAAETEELWFPIWEFKGMPWENRELYARFSPSQFVTEFRTPTLVTHGELDYRVPVGQSIQLFTALQLRKVPSKLVLFPDEGHWILKPRNSLFWYSTFLDWIKTWTEPKKEPSAASP